MFTLLSDTLSFYENALALIYQPFTSFFALILHHWGCSVFSTEAATECGFVFTTFATVLFFCEGL